MRKRFVLMLQVCVPLVLLDQLTKIWATANLAGRPARSFWGDAVRLEYALNPGAWGGLGGQLPDAARKLIFTVGVGLLLAFLTVYIIRELQPRMVTLALSFLLAGGVGNLIDRALYGYVVDFLYLGWPGSSWLHTNIFNVADVAVMIGAGILIWQAFVPDKKPDPTPDEAIET